MATIGLTRLLPKPKHNLTVAKDETITPSVPTGGIGQVSKREGGSSSCRGGGGGGVVVVVVVVENLQY